jgi:hypothetical protein
VDPRAFLDTVVKRNLHLVPRLIMLEAISSLSQYVIMAWYLVKHRKDFTRFHPVSVKLLRNFRTKL